MNDDETASFLAQALGEALEAETSRQEWERCLALVAAVREAFYDLAPPDVQAAFDVLARLKVPDDVA